MRARGAMVRTSGVLLLLLCGAGSAAGQMPLRQANFIPLWLPQAQFAGYYVALERGIYRRHGIDLTILPGGPDQPVSKALQEGQGGRLRQGAT